MALHTPTDWDLSYDATEVRPGRIIKETIPTLVVQNQQYSVERDRMILSMVWPPYEVTGAAWATNEALEGIGPNLLGLAATGALAGAILCRAVNAGDTFEVRAYDAVHGSLTASYTPGDTNWAWRGWLGGAFAAPATGVAWTFTVDSKLTAGPGGVQTAGVCLFY